MADPSLSLLSPSFSRSAAGSIKPYTGSIQTRSYGALTAGGSSASSVAMSGSSASAAAGRRGAASASGAASGGNKVKEFLRAPGMVAALPFINGGLSGMVATAVIQPIDMVSVRAKAGQEPKSRGC